MKLVVFDAETYWDAEYSLRKMPVDEYVLDPRFELILYGLKIGDAPARVHLTLDALHELDWNDTALIAHNVLFDVFILTQLGFRPKMWVDTVSLTRMLFPWEKSHGLGALCKIYGLPAKGDYPLRARGMRRKDFNPVGLAEYGDYCLGDVNNTYHIALDCLRRAPKIELEIGDMTTRMFTEPQFVGDAPMMKQLWEAEISRKADLLSRAGIARETLLSDRALARELLIRGVEPPTKISARTGKTAYAFAKTDEDFLDLLNHEDAEVPALVEARLGIKSTIAETRTSRMLKIAQRGGKMPVFLNHWGAKMTGRHSGGNFINWQNIPARGPNAGLRNAIKAPPGHKVIVGDSSAIELRVAMVGAGEVEVVNRIREGSDEYSLFATEIFGTKVTKEAMPLERRVGKIGMLSLQYGTGATKYQTMVRIETGRKLTDTDAFRVVELYRSRHHRIQQRWLYIENVIFPDIVAGCPNWLPIDVNAWCITSNGGFGVLGSPGVVYHNLRFDGSGPKAGWRYEQRGNLLSLYGSKGFEHYCQHVARQIVLWQTVQFNKEYPVALSAHDEVAAVVPERKAKDAAAYLKHCLTTAPPWCGDLIPLACEVGIGDSYGDAKP